MVETVNGRTFENWWEELRGLLTEWHGAAYAANTEDWREYWLDDYTPEQARAEDASYA